MSTEERPLLSAVGWLVAIACIALAGLQFVRPGLADPPVTADLQAPPEIKEILRTSCYNCHSNETKLLWFDKPVPAYWIVARDVREGRKHLNFSEIANLPAGQQRGILFEAVSQIELGAMPLPSYKPVHPESAITPEQLNALKNYLGSGISNTPATPAQITAADAQYDKWIQGGGATPAVQPAPNGIEFIPDYKNWKTISSTDRPDNGTVREILGNDIAVKAIAEDHINPWPDGTAFAKVAWFEQPDEKGLVRTGAFFQVEFMIRDAKKYAGTLGWGFARWRGADLKPYGKDAAFTEECVGCHNPMRNADYVFTEPIRGQP
jgi:heme-binding protein/cytochrome P460